RRGVAADEARAPILVHRRSNYDSAARRETLAYKATTPPARVPTVSLSAATRRDAARVASVAADVFALRSVTHRCGDRLPVPGGGQSSHGTRDHLLRSGGT